MSERPRIAVPVPTSADLEYNRRCWPDYAEAVSVSGGVAVEVPLSLTTHTLAELCNSCGGILLPGSPADVDPRRYGQEAVPECAPADLRREETDLFLLEQAATHGIPLLAVCFGAQILNVSRGGSLLQDLTVMPVNHAAGPGVGIAHSVAVCRDSVLGSLVPGNNLVSEGGGKQGQEFLSLPVNSSHHQAVAVPGAGLRVTGRCPQDGVIEALEGDQERFLVAVQWHPERNFAQSAASQALFARFMAAVRERQG